MTGHLPHHRRGPRIDEQRRDADDPGMVSTIIAFGYVAGVVLLVLFAFSVVA